jgi:hypothetical protein
VGTIKSRATALARQGKIQARPRGGAYPRQHPLARQEPPPRPVQSRAVQSRPPQPWSPAPPSPRRQSSTCCAKRWRASIPSSKTLRPSGKIIILPVQGRAVQDRAEQCRAVQSSADLTPLTPEEAKAERWNLWLPRGLRQRIEAVAKARGHALSKVVQEALWQWVATAEGPR